MIVGVAFGMGIASNVETHLEDKPPKSIVYHLLIQHETVEFKKGNIAYLTTDRKASLCQMAKDDHRASKRLAYEAPVTVENCDNGEYFYGRMYNYSLGGMYFETDYPLPSGAEIRVAIRKSKNGPGFDHFRAKVKWCEEIPEAVVLYNYGVGVQYLPSFTQSKCGGKLKVIQGGANRTDQESI